MIPMSLYSTREQTLVREHLKSLQGYDRYLRFGAMLSDLSIDNYIDQRWSSPNEWLGIIESGRVIAVVHIAIEDDNKAELGLSVDADWRGKKLGQALFERAVIFLRARAIRDVYMHCLSENQAMKHIARKHMMHMEQLHGEVDADLILPPPTPFDEYQEVLTQTLSIYDNNTRQLTSAWRNTFNIKND